MRPRATLYPSFHNTEQGGSVVAGTCSVKGSALTRDGSPPSHSTPLSFQEAQRSSNNRQEQNSGSAMKILAAFWREKAWLTQAK